jgi:serine/threonine protein kinase
MSINILDRSPFAVEVAAREPRKHHKKKNHKDRRVQQTAQQAFEVTAFPVINQQPFPPLFLANLPPMQMQTPHNPLRPLQLEQIRQCVKMNPPFLQDKTAFYPATGNQPPIFFMPFQGYFALAKTIIISANKTVYEVVNIDTEELRALALIQVTSENSHQINNEKYFHQKFSEVDPQQEFFVAGSMGDFLIDQRLHTGFLMPLMKGGDVAKYLNKHPETNGEQIMQMFAHMLQSIAIMHHQGIRHGDIKRENFLIRTNPLKPKISDFGTCSLSDPRIKAALNDPKIRSPEFVRYGGLGTGRKADIWALGVTLAEMFGASDKDLLGLGSAVNSMDDNLIHQWTQHLANSISLKNPHAGNVIRNCLHVDQHHRPDIDQLMLIAKNQSIVA